MIILRLYKIGRDKKRLPCHDCGANIAVVDRRAKDGDTKMSSGMVGGGCVVGSGASRTVSLAAADLDFWRSFCPRATDGGQLAEGGRRRGRLSSLLLFYFRPGTQGQYHRRPIVVAVVYQAAQLPTAAFGHRRHAQQTLRTQSARGGHPSQSHSGTGRCEIPLRAYLGHLGLDRAASLVGNYWPAIAGQTVRAPEGHCQDSQGTLLEVSNQACAGGGFGRLGRGNCVFFGKTPVGRGRRLLRQTALSQAGAEGWRGGRKPPAQGRLLVHPAAETQKRGEAKTRRAAQVRCEADQSGQTRGGQTRLADHGMRTIRENGKQKIQNIPGYLPTGLRRNPGGDRTRTDRPPVFLRHRSPGCGQRDIGNSCRPCSHRTGLSRPQGSLGSGPTTGPLPVGEHRRVSFESLDAYAGGTVVVAALARDAVRPQRLAAGRPRATPLARRSPPRP